MALETITAPTSEPVSLTEMRSHSRIDFNDEDADASAALVAARERVEAFLNRRLITQTVRITLNSFPAFIVIPLAPVQSITQIEYTDADGVDQVMSAADYRIIKAGGVRSIVPAYNGVWPTPRADFDAVRVDVVVGYGDSAGDVPENFRAAIRQMANDLYENRGDVVIGTISSELASGAKSYLLPHVFTA